MSHAPNTDGAAAMRCAGGRAEHGVLGATRRLSALLERAPSPEVCVMRSASWTRGATCALAISISLPAAVAFADRDGKKSISSCTSFGQEDKGEDKVQFTIHNTCSVPLDCSISWRVVCAPESKKRRAAHPGLAKLALTNGTTQSAEASASVCGHDAWAIDSINWSCQPNKE